MVIAISNGLPALKQKRLALRQPFLLLSALNTNREKMNAGE
ncbi:hypothetical protein VS84_03595 [Vibrio cholerae]|nr:hypothetical protein VS84_03595 [Vibrio cholerae]